MKSHYFAVEQAILADWLGQERPAAARGIPIDHPRHLRSLQTVYPQAVRPRRLADGTFGEHTLANAVARIALTAVPLRLAVAASAARAPQDHLATPADVDPAPPRLLFEVDWEPRGSARFQPEAYLLCDLPGFGVRAVVASRDSAEAYGYGTVAAGWFHAWEPAQQAVSRVLHHWWTRHKDRAGWARWEVLLATGLVTDVQASAWADRVWGPRPEVQGKAG